MTVGSGGGSMQSAAMMGTQADHTRALMHERHPHACMHQGLLTPGCCCRFTLLPVALCPAQIALEKNIAYVWYFWDTYKLFSEWDGVLSRLYLSSSALVAGWVSQRCTRQVPRCCGGQGGCLHAAGSMPARCCRTLHSR